MDKPKPSPDAQADPATPIYTTEKLMEETRRLAAEYRRTTGEALPVSADIGRFDCAKHLQLEVPVKRQAGVDLIGKDQSAYPGKRFQVKARVIFDPSNSRYRIGQLSCEQTWDILALVLLDEDYKTASIYIADKSLIAEALRVKSKRNSRGALSVNKFLSFADKVWENENL